MKQLMKPYDGMRAKIRKVNVNRIYDNGPEPHEMETK